MIRRKYIGVLEVLLVLTLFIYLQKLFRNLDFTAWQLPLFGAALVTSCLLMFVLPMIFFVLRRGNGGIVGLGYNAMNYHMAVAKRTFKYVLPAALLFPVIGMLGSSPTLWLGGSILTIGFLLTGFLFAINSTDLANRSPTQFHIRDISGLIALLVGGLIAIYLLFPLSTIVAGVIEKIIFVALLEEFLFRGYVQTRLNESFEKPFVFANVQFGPALIITALVFGLFHPLTVVNEIPWAWGLWTAAFGLVLGFVREKTGSILAPATIHAVFILPTVFFASS